MDHANERFEDDREDLRSGQSDAPIIDGIVHTVEIQIDSMIVEDQTDENDTGESDRRFDQQTKCRILVIDTIERHFTFDHHQDDAEHTEKTHQITDHASGKYRETQVESNEEDRSGLPLNVQLFAFGETIADVGHQGFLHYATLLRGQSTQFVFIDGQTLLARQSGWRGGRGCHRYTR